MHRCKNILGLLSCKTCLIFSCKTKSAYWIFRVFSLPDYLSEQNSAQSGYAGLFIESQFTGTCNRKSHLISLQTFETIVLLSRGRQAIIFTVFFNDFIKSLKVYLMPFTEFYRNRCLVVSVWYCVHKFEIHLFFLQYCFFNVHIAISSLRPRGLCFDS